MCNFDGAMAVLAGLSLLAVSRLKEVVWKRLDSKLEMFKEFERKLTAMDGIVFNSCYLCFPSFFFFFNVFVFFFFF